MPQLRAFRGIHYDFERHPDLSRVLSPVRDDPPEPEALLALEAAPPGRSAHLLQDWLSRGILVRDGRPCLYVVSTRFEVEGETRVRRGLLAAVRLDGGGVGPSSNPPEADVRDGLERLRANHVQTSPVLMLHDDGGEADALLAPLVVRTPDATATTADGARHELWRVSDERAIRAAVEAVAPASSVVVGGAALREAGLLWAAECAIGGEPPGPQDFMLAFLVSYADPGLVVRPIHRLLRAALPDPARLALLLGEHFEVDELPEDPTRPAGLRWALRRLAEAGKTGHAFVLFTGSDRRARLLTLRQGLDLAHVHAMPRNPTLRSVDVAILHALVLQNVLGLSPQEQEQALDYDEDPGRAVLRAQGPQATMAVLLNPTPPWQLRAAAEAGVPLPARSLSLFPSVPSGLALLVVHPRG